MESEKESEKESETESEMEIDVELGEDDGIGYHQEELRESRAIRIQSIVVTILIVLARGVASLFGAGAQCSFWQLF